MKNDLVTKILHDWRIKVALKQVRGNLLDIACGDNMLVASYDGNGTGLDVQQWGNVDVVVDSSSTLPFPDNTFDTVTIIASMNYLDDRDKTLAEIQRVLVPGGRLVVTTISEKVGRIWSKLRGLDKGWDDPLTLEGIQSGLSPVNAQKEMIKSGLTPILHKRFMFGLNNLIVAAKD